MIENKKKAMHEWNKMIDLVQIRKFNDNQKDEIVIDGCITFFKEYKSNGMLNQVVKPVDSLLAIFYDKLKEKKILILAPDVKLAIYDEATKEYKQTLEDAKKNRKLKFEQKDMDLLLGMMANNSNKPFANVCKRISLIRFFNDLIEMDQDLETLLKNKNV